MKYMGSKARIAKDIIPIILQHYEDGMIFIDACVGGSNIIDKIPSNIPRYANDNNKYLIALYKGLQMNLERPFDISKELYSKARNIYNNNILTEMSDFEIGWIGFMASANGRFFEGGYSGISKTKIGTERNYISESIRGIEKQMPLLKTVFFSNIDILLINPKTQAIIYCDIPYKNTKHYSTSKNFDYDAFYKWCEEMKKDGHYVYVSEYIMPENFKCVWQKELKSSLSANGKSGGNKLSTEKLFTL